MKCDFQLVAAPLEDFTHLFSLMDEELATLGATRMTVDAKPGYPCRVSLMDAEIGERVILTSFKHHDVPSPYKGIGPVFVREAAQTVQLHVNEIPSMFHHRLLSLRAYDKSAMIWAQNWLRERSWRKISDFFLTNLKWPICICITPARVATIAW
jgi:hypothetical protein